jgi:hypothetical protein
MEYTTPEVNVVGTGSELVQAFVGPLTDGGAHALSQMAVNSCLEEE